MADWNVCQVHRSGLFVCGNAVREYGQLSGVFLGLPDVIRTSVIGFDCCHSYITYEVDREVKGGMEVKGDMGDKNNRQIRNM